MEWSVRGLTVAVKCNGTDCADTAAIDNERRLYELLKDNPHDHILPVYAICTDAPDGKARLVMKCCAKGSLDDYLVGVAKPEVCGPPSPRVRPPRPGPTLCPVRGRVMRLCVWTCA
jgi:hypothetical protein